jgi:hypothetical protein
MKAGFSRLDLQQLIIIVFNGLWLLATVLSTSGCSLSRKPDSTSPQADELFQRTIELPIEPRIYLFSEKNEYRREDWIGIWVENRINHTLRFKDQSLGLQAYKYYTEDGTWRSVLDPTTIIDSDVVIVTPGPRSALPIISIPARWIKGTGTIRLVITGTTEQGGPFAAYKDIEIID